MAQITKYVAQQGLNPGSAPRANVQDYMSGAVQNLGQEISSAAELFQRKAEEKENFKAETEKRNFDLRMGEQLQQHAEQMPVDGTGFHDDFYENVFRPERDKFLASIPPRLRERYESLLADNDGPDATAWSIKAAQAERDQTYKWAGEQLATGQEQLAAAIAMDPDNYDAFLQQGLREIETSPMTPTMKAQAAKNWERMAQLAHLDRMIEKDPEGVLKSLGADPRRLSPTTQFSSLKAALIHQESSGRPNAVSPKGAIGLMQVMPGTAREIAEEIGDENFPHKGDPVQVYQYLADPIRNQRYGDYYLKKQIRAFREHGLEAALIAYNGGAKRAKKWIESGYDDSVLPAETRKYYKAIMARLPGVNGSNLSEYGNSDPDRVQLTFTGRRGGREEDLNQDLTRRLKTAFSGIGIDKLKITSGYRDEATNKSVGGAENSQHIHRNAVDIDVTGYSTAERVKIIQALSNAGIGGIGVGANIIHADIGARRAWGYARSSGGGEVPKWAKAAIDDHLAGKAVNAPGAVGLQGRYANLPYADRQNYIAKADQIVTQRYNAETKANVTQRVQMQNMIANELASLTTTGVSTNQLDENQIASQLGESEYLKFIDKRERALRTFNATQGIEQMTPDEMADRLADYTPTPGSDSFAEDQQVQAAVQKKIDQITRERSRRPDRAALQFPEVKEAYDAVSGMENPSPQAMQEFIRLSLERQKEFGLKPGSEAPIPREWAMQVGRSIAKIPEIAGDNFEDVNAQIVQQYQVLEEIFGEYTDEVILYSLQQFKGVGKNTAELIDGYMKAIQAGGDPLNLNADQAQDMDQVEQLADEGFFSKVKRFFTGDEEPDDAGDPETDEPSAEVIQRAVDALTWEPEDEASAIARYGKAAVDAAKRQMGSQ